MIFSPDLKTFKKRPKEANLLVLSAKAYTDCLTPVSVYAQIRKMTTQESFLLESVDGEEKVSRFSFIGFSPLVTVKFKNKKLIVSKQNKIVKQQDNVTDPLDELRKLMAQFNPWPLENIRFFGGFVGFCAYDIIRFYEPIGQLPKDTLQTEDMYFILPEFLIIFDHLKKQLEILCFILLEKKKPVKDEQLYRQGFKRLKKIIEYISISQPLEPFYLPSLTGLKSSQENSLNIKAHFNQKEFINAVKKAKNYIKQGEIIQVVLSERFSVEYNQDPFQVYRYLRVSNPSPYMFFLDFSSYQIVGASPEMLLRLESGKLITRPIAGTRRRGNNDEEDEKLKKELLSDEKERAEHVMLVDLGRNDLGRVSQKGSVKVPIFMSVEKFSHVMHIVSEVQGKIAKGKDMFDGLKACFPAGTVSGAPKVRAMQIIYELEPEARGIYAGCIGYFSFTKALDTCIIIRTIVFKDNKAYVQAGAGIVADSQPKKEFQEISNKAYAQLLAIKLASKKT